MSNAANASPLSDTEFRIGDTVSFPYGEDHRFEGVITGYSTRWILIGTAPTELHGSVRDGFAIDSQHGMRLLKRGPELAPGDIQEWQGHVWKRESDEAA